MTIGQVKSFYMDKKNFPCPITESLVKAGYVQKSSGYIKFARECEEVVDYKQAKPTQWWHLIKSYCERKNQSERFTKRVQCGELWFWMAEVSGVFTECELKALRNKAINNIMDRRNGNKIIRDYCYDRIVKAVDNI